MFDPTAFENMKVVIEGEIYDMDLSGGICVTNRDDIMNLSKLSRKYEITFSHPGKQDVAAATMILEADLANLSSELLQTNPDHDSGCSVTIKFALLHKNEEVLFILVQKAIRSIWGNDRLITQLVTHSPFANEEDIEHNITISFNRLIIEDQIDDLIDMVHHVILTLVELEMIISKG